MRQVNPDREEQATSVLQISIFPRDFQSLTRFLASNPGAIPKYYKERFSLAFDADPGFNSLYKSRFGILYIL
jgi:hypothetical protein